MNSVKHDTIKIFDTSKDKDFSISSDAKENTEETTTLLKKTPKNSSNSSWKKGFIIFGIVFVITVILYFLLVQTGLLRKASIFIFEKLHALYLVNPISTYLLLYVIQILSLMLLLPFHTIMTFIIYSIFNNIWISFFHILISSVSGSLVIYLISSSGLKPWIESKFEENEVYNILKKYSQEKPWKTAFLTRFLFIAAGVKDYTLSLIQNPLWSYTVSAAVVHSCFIFEVGLIHTEIKQISGFFDSNTKSWGDRSVTQKISSMFMILLIVFTIGVMVYLGFHASKLFKKEKRKPEEIAY